MSGTHVREGEAAHAGGWNVSPPFFVDPLLDGGAGIAGFCVCASSHAVHVCIACLLFYVRTLANIASS